jgi:hypothetical protein
LVYDSEVAMLKFATTDPLLRCLTSGSDPRFPINIALFIPDMLIDYSAKI